MNQRISFTFSFVEKDEILYINFLSNKIKWMVMKSATTLLCKNLHVIKVIFYQFYNIWLLNERYVLALLSIKCVLEDLNFSKLTNFAPVAIFSSKWI